MWHLTIATALLLGQVSANVLSDAATQLVRRIDGTEAQMKRYVDSIVEPIERRQSSTAAPAINLTQWDAQTMLACTTALEALNGNASNPSGMAVCYNLPYLDNSTGVFEADLRLFTVSAPSGNFANIASQNVMVGLSYSGATVSAVNASSLKRRSDAVSLISWPRSEDGMKKRADVPTMAQSYAFVGQINQNLLGNMNTATLQEVLVPVVTLTGVDPSGSTVNTTLSSSEATFVSGVFADQVAPTKSTVQSPIQTLVVAANAPFVVPGLNILIFPIGGIITGVWAILFIGTVTYGTIGRMQFREQYRRRAARAAKEDIARI